MVTLALSVEFPHDATVRRRVLFDIPTVATLHAAWRARYSSPPPPTITIADDHSFHAPPYPDELAHGTPVLLWWNAAAGTLLRHADRVLRQLVYPLACGDRIFWIAFPFSAELLAPRPLTLTSRALLDVEDIGRLLASCCATSSPMGHTGLSRRSSPPSRTVPHQVLPLDPDLDQAQQQAILHPFGPLRVLAPAGAGKTKTMINRISALVAQGVHPGSILSLAFNTKAAEQLEERLGRLGLPTTRRLADRTGVHCATFNAFGHRYLSEVVNQPFTVDASAAAEERLVRQALWRHLKPRGAQRDAPLESTLSAVLDDLTWRAREHLAALRADCAEVDMLTLPIPPALREQRGGPSSLPFGRVLRDIRGMQRRRQAISFDDQVHACLLDLLARPDRRAAFQRQFRHVLVDEFQDLNRAQLALVDVLSRPHRNLFVVGDDDQLIYGWRFARVATILNFTDTMPQTPHASSVILTTNYRCSREVVRRASQLIAHNHIRIEKAVRCRPDAAEGMVAFVASSHWPLRAQALAEFMANEHAARSCRWQDLAVLCRYRCQQPLAVAALNTAGIPASLPEPAPFAHGPGAELLCRCLRLLQEPARDAQPDTAALARSLGLSTTVLLRRARDLRRWIRAEQPAAREVVATVLNELPVESAALRREHRGPRGSAAGSNETGGATRALEAAQLLSMDHGSFTSFLSLWEELTYHHASPTGAAEPAAASTPADAIVVSTIHAAKGREYGAVAILDYATDLAALDQNDAEEERRVLYVALTRAQHDALFTVDTAKWAPHPFLHELANPPRPAELPALRRRLAHTDHRLTELTAMDHRGAQSRQDIGALHLHRLSLASRLTEHRLFRPSSRLGTFLRGGVAPR